MLIKLSQTQRITEMRGEMTKQNGLVLFVALIALVVMSLAAVALIRSVDSGTLVAGNLAFKQSAILSGDTGVADAYTFINNSNPSTLNTGASGAGSAGPAGYYPTLDDTIVLTDASNWTEAKSFLVDKDPNDRTGNIVRYIVQRMCRTTGEVDKNNCLVGLGESSGKSNGGLNIGGGSGGNDYGAPKSSADAVFYRVTVRVSGPKNTVSYLQAFIY
jgi:Tfp pilus assembly protein PilX